MLGFLHHSSSFIDPCSLDDVGFDGCPSESRGGGGRARIALRRAAEAERTTDIRRDASKMLQCRVEFIGSGEELTVAVPMVD